VNTSSGFSVRMDFERILETISSRIYDNQYAFLRENVQNAIDAIRIQALRDKKSTKDHQYRIEITIDNNRCSIKDNGIGMTQVELANNFWTIGASGKTTSEARAAGCIGVFGIGGFANFGVCDTLEVISRSQACESAHFTSLSTSAFKDDRFTLPMVTYQKSDELLMHGTIVRGIGKAPFDAASLATYLKQFVRYVSEPIYFQGNLISQEIMSPQPNYREVTPVITSQGNAITVTFQLFADEGNNLAVKISKLKIGGEIYECYGDARLVHGQVEVYKRGFRICTVSVSSRIGVSGKFDSDFLQPTAGRDSLDGKSHTLLNQIFQIIETAAYPVILNDSDLLSNHIRLLPQFLAQGQLERIGQLTVKTIDSRDTKLAELRQWSEEGKRIFYSYSGHSTPAAEVLQARGHIIVTISANRDRRIAEVEFLRTFCRGEEFENVIECQEPYIELDIFDRAILAELDYAIRRLYNPAPYQFIAGKLTLDVPIYWSGKKEGGATVVFVDTRHGEFQKLKPLGLSPLFWSMIEAFCREYLGETLKRQSPKFFGSGAIDLDAYNKSFAELWELLSTDIEVSRITEVQSNPVPHQKISHIELVRVSDVVNVTISSTAVVSTPSEIAKKLPPKLLRIIDETKTTGLDGYYLRIPETATGAFGDLIRTFPTFVLIWFANRITWQGSDLKSTAFLFEVTLESLIPGNTATEVAYGAVNLGPSKIQMYNEQIYFFISPAIQDQLVPKSDNEPVKIEITHRLLDLGKPRSWTSKTQVGSRD
jgi:molecular chaperone HtpG